MAANLLTVTLVLTEFRWQQHWKTSSVCDLLLKVIVDWLFVNRKWSQNTENYCSANFEQDFRNDSRVCGDWLLHHDNAPAHSSNFVQQFLAKHKIVQLRQPPYSPGIALCDFWMFRKLKMALIGKRFDEIETIQSNATRELKAIPKSAFEDCFKMWKHRWERVVQSNGDYFERCHSPDDEE